MWAKTNEYCPVCKGYSLEEHEHVIPNQTHALITMPAAQQAEARDAAFDEVMRRCDALEAKLGGKLYLQAELDAELAALKSSQQEEKVEVRELQDQLWCQALEFSHTGTRPTLDAGWEEQGPLETRKELIRHSPLMDAAESAHLAEQAKLERIIHQQNVERIAINKENQRNYNALLAEQAKAQEAVVAEALRQCFQAGCIFCRQEWKLTEDGKSHAHPVDGRRVVCSSYFIRKLKPVTVIATMERREREAREAHQNELADLRKALRRVIREHSELLAAIKVQADLETNLFEARQALLTVGQEAIKQKEMLIWAFQHAQLDDEATTGQQEDFSDMHEKCRDYLYPDAQPKEVESFKQQLDTSEALRIWQATELARMQKELRGYASIEGKAHVQTIDERDAAEDSLSQAYFLVKGESPQWSNNFGHKEALEEIEDTQKCLRAEIAAAEQTSLASQAKLIRKCAELLNCDCPDLSKPCPLARHREAILANLTPAMLQAEEAALAAEKAVLAAEQERK